MTNGLSKRRRIDSILKVSGTDIVDGNGRKVILKGAGLGGHLNMENFITGFSGHEHEHRAALLSVLGPQKYKFFFDKFLEYFFTSSDAKFFASLGVNCIRVPFNYRHFEDDMNPGVYKEEGFQLLDRIVNLCSEQNLYVILDLHAVPGGQNQDWHSDSGSSKAMFWNFKEFQDRMINLWVALAKHYKGNPFIAGYNPLNEPADPDHVNLINFYYRIEKAIREVDPDHVLFIDGNTYAMDFSRFVNVLKFHLHRWRVADTNKLTARPSSFSRAQTHRVEVKPTLPTESMPMSSVANGVGGCPYLLKQK